MCINSLKGDLEMRNNLASKLTFGVLVLFAHAALAKDLTSRLGVGVKDNTGVSIPSMAAVYWVQPDMALTGGLGIDTAKNESKFTFNAGLRKVLFKEDNMHFYFGGQLGLLNNEVAGDKQSGFELSGVFGSEFFLAGLDSLAFTFEGGLAMTSLKEVRFRTVGDHILRAGMIFYF